jgi:hypothetical protein
MSFILIWKIIYLYFIIAIDAILVFVFYETLMKGSSLRSSPFLMYFLRKYIKKGLYSYYYKYTEALYPHPYLID